MVKDVMTTQKGQCQNIARDLKNVRILLQNSAEGLGFRREHCWGYISVCGNTPK